MYAPSRELLRYESLFVRSEEKERFLIPQTCLRQAGSTRNDDGSIFHRAVSEGRCATTHQNTTGSRCATA